MRKILTALVLAAAAPALAAQTDHGAVRQEDGSTGAGARLESGTGNVELGARSTGLNYHNGPVLVSAKAVLIFWGPSFSNPRSPDFAYAQALMAFRNQLGTSHPYGIITQYYQIVGGVTQFIELANLGAGTPDWFDSSLPPTAVTDAKVQSEVRKYLASHTFDTDTIYQVFIPSTSYSTNGGESSCGGPNLAYCAYHSSFLSNTDDVVYSIQPYPSCSGCQRPAFTPVENQEHFVCHETRETVTDPLGTGWWQNTTGEEGDSLCGLTGFTVTSVCGETWSNAANMCVM